jgi:hypothetical protein
MPGDSGSSSDTGSTYFKVLLDPGDFNSNPSGLLSFNKSETVLWTIAKILYYFLYMEKLDEPIKSRQSFTLNA